MTCLSWLHSRRTHWCTAQVPSASQGRLGDKRRSRDEVAPLASITRPPRAIAQLCKCENCSHNNISQLHNCANCAGADIVRWGRGANCCGGEVPLELRHLPWHPTNPPPTILLTPPWALPAQFCHPAHWEGEGGLSLALADTPHLVQSPSSLFNSLHRWGDEDEGEGDD